MLTLTQLEYWKQRPSGLTLGTITHAVCLLRRLYSVVSRKFPLWITCLQSFNPAHLRPKCTGRDNSFLTHLCWFLVYKEGVSWFLIKEIEQLAARGLNYHCWAPCGVNPSKGPNPTTSCPNCPIPHALPDHAPGKMHLLKLIAVIESWINSCPLSQCFIWRS